MLHHRRGQHRSEKDSWRSLKLFQLYRTSVALLIFVLPLLGLVTGSGLGMFKEVSQAYLLLNLTLIFPTFMQNTNFRPLVVAMVVIDIVALTLLTHSGTSLGRDFELLIIPTIAGASLLLPGIRAPFFAALATLAVLIETGYGHWLGRYDGGDFPAAGIQGILFFTVAILAAQLARKAATSEALAAQRGRDLRDLATLNAHIIERMHAGVLVVGDDRTVRLANQAALQVLGKPRVRATDTLDTFAPPLQQCLDTWMTEASDGGVRQEPCNVHGATEYTARFIRIGSADQRSTLIFLDDLREQLRQVRDAKLAALGRLTASIAHEIRNPLGAMSHAAQLLLESDQLAPADTRLARIVQNNAARMNTLIQNILDLAQHRPPQAEAFALLPWLEAVAEEFRQVRKLKPAQIELDVPETLPTTRFDPSQLHQIVWNLLSNAESHAHGEQPLRVRLVARFAPHQRTVHLEVVDNGPGVPKELEERLFEPFFTTAERGTGLGLYIARELSERNGGSLEYQRASEGGSCFRLRLPIEGKAKMGE